MNLFQKLLLISFLFYSSNLLAQQPENYLSAHAADLSKGTIENDQILGSRFYDHQLFLVGEIHGIKRGQDVDLAFLKLLNQKLKVTTYIAEVDFAKAYYLNQFLKTGDEKLLTAVFEDWAAQDAQWANTDFQDKIRKIRAYNQSLNDSLQIHFEGIDQIQNPVLAARYFKEILKDDQFSTISVLFNPLIEALELKNDSLIIIRAVKLISDLKGNTILNPRLAKFGRKANDLRFALHNCMLVKTSREAVMHTNFKELFMLRNWKNEKLYSFLGFGHVLQSKTNSDKSVFLAYRLENDQSLPLKGKIASIAMIYVGSKMSMPTAYLPVQFQDKGKRFTAFSQYNHDGPLVKLDGIEAFKAVTKENSTTLFDLTATGSPYFQKVLNIDYAALMPADQRLYFNEKGKFITDYFQYVVLVRNSEATNPILP